MSSGIDALQAPQPKATLGHAKGKSIQQGHFSRGANVHVP